MNTQLVNASNDEYDSTSAQQLQRYKFNINLWFALAKANHVLIQKN